MYYSNIPFNKWVNLESLYFTLIDFLTLGERKILLLSSLDDLSASALIQLAMI